MKLFSLLPFLLLLGCNLVSEEAEVPKSNAEKLIRKWRYFASEEMTPDSIISVVPMKKNAMLDFRSNNIVYSEMENPNGVVEKDSAVWSATESVITFIAFDNDSTEVGYEIKNDTLKTTFVYSDGDTDFDYFLGL